MVQEPRVASGCLKVGSIGSEAYRAPGIGYETWPR